MLPTHTPQKPAPKRSPGLLGMLVLATMLGSFGPAPSASAAFLQDGDRPAPTEVEREQVARERARSMVEARIERLRAEQARLEATLAAIDAGQSLSELRIPDDEQRSRPRPRPDTEPDGSQPDGDEDFSDEEIKAFIAEVYPQWIERMNELERRDPETAARMLRERRPRLVELMIERRDHPQVFEARQKIARSEMQIRRVAWTYARAEDDAEKQQAEEALALILEEQFDLRLDLYRAELTEAEAAAEEIRTRLNDAIANRAKLISERKADLLKAIRDRRPPQSPRGGRPDRDGGPPRR
jgi:hypothetical protein